MEKQTLSLKKWRKVEWINRRQLCWSRGKVLKIIGLGWQFQSLFMEFSFYQSSNSVIKWPHACSQVPLCQEYLTNNYWIFIIVDNMLDEAEDRGKKGEGSTNWEKSSDRNRWGNRWQAFSANESFLSDPSPIVALATLVTNSLTDSLLNSLLFRRLDWCAPIPHICQFWYTTT